MADHEWGSSTRVVSADGRPIVVRHYLGVRLRDDCPRSIVQSILAGMWQRHVDAHGPGVRSDHSSLDEEDAQFRHHVVTWEPEP